ncbi:hypothetical protein IEO21_01759 [Rhodonia placenta]|uniref:Uncharacterized protein n=1 Tax=Rhodonia placenta TaxID=104341 RepID=A0A8H7P978_9APHY|nr:hypothetical protein IEO21_01759 [Postia placenta]
MAAAARGLLAAALSLPRASRFALFL